MLDSESIVWFKEMWTAFMMETEKIRKERQGTAPKNENAAANAAPTTGKGGRQMGQSAGQFLFDCP